MKLQDAIAELKYYKDNEVVDEVKSSAIKVIPSLNEKGIVTPYIKYAGNSRPVIKQAFSQFLNYVVGPGANSLWKFADSSANVHKRFMFQKAQEMIQKKIDNMRKPVLIHRIKDKVWGATSTKYSKVHDIDVLNTVLDYLGDGEFYDCWHYPNRTAFDFRLESFKDPLDQVYHLNVRTENNQWGRHSLALKPAIVRQICSNGAVVPVVSMKNLIVRHVGDINLGAIRNFIANVKENGYKAAELIKAGFNANVKIEEYLDHVVQRYRVSKKDRKKVETYLLLEDHPNTIYAIANAVSRLANDYTNEKRFKLQTIAGHIYSDL